MEIVCFTKTLKWTSHCFKRYQHHYQQTEYNNMVQLIEEKFQAMIAQQIHEDDHVIVASDARHNRQIANHIPAKSLSYSFLKIEMKLCQMRNINLS